MSKYIIGKFYMTFINGKPVAGYLRKIAEYENNYIGIELQALNGTIYSKAIKEEG